MTVDLNSATLLIKKAGPQKVRILPMTGQAINEGDYQIEIKDDNNWSVIVSGVKKVVAEQLVGQALNRTICG